MNRFIGEPAELHGEFIKDTKWNSLVLDEVENGRNRLLAGEPVDSTVVRLAFTTYGVGQTFPGGELKTMFLEATDKKKSCYYNARTNLIKKEVLVEHGHRLELTEIGAAEYGWHVAV